MVDWWINKDWMALLSSNFKGLLKLFYNCQTTARPAAAGQAKNLTSISNSFYPCSYIYIDILTCMQISWDDNHWLYKNVDILSVMLDMSSWMQDRMYEKNLFFFDKGMWKINTGLSRRLITNLKKLSTSLTILIYF